MAISAVEAQVPRPGGATRRRLIGAAAAAPAAVLAACAGAAGNPAARPEVGTATITYAFLGNPAFLQMNQDAAREFETAYPSVKLELAHMPTGMYDKIQNLYSGGAAPDVWEPDAARFPGWADRASFYDVTPLAKRDQGKGANKIDLD